MSEVVQESAKSATPKNKKKIAIISTVIAVVIIAVVVAVLVVMLGGNLKSSIETINIGISKEKVLEQLGNPYAGKDSNTWEYYSKDYEEGDKTFEYASIVFDENGNVSQVSYNASGKNTSNKELTAVTLLSTGNFYVSIPTPVDNPDAWEKNTYDLVYQTDYKDGSFSKVLVKDDFSTESTETIVLSWTDGFGISSQAKIRFSYPKTVTYVMNGGINASSNIEGFTDEYLESLEGGFELQAPSINACEFADVKANADGSISCVVIEKEFEGWYSDASFKNKVTHIEAGSNSITLYAKWGKEISRTTYTDEEYVRGADMVLFGVYPQSLKAENVTVSETATSEGYYTGSDGMLYVKVVATPYDNGYKFSNGTKISKGKTYYFKLEPIKWRILGTDGTNATLFGTQIIDGMSYDDKSVSWKSSNIREWLNSDFLTDAFNSAQAQLINLVQVDNDLASAPVSASGKNDYIDETDNVTEDKVWLLSYEDAQNEAYGFVGELAMGDSVQDGYDDMRAMEVSDYARATGTFIKVEKNGYGYGSWWLRSPYYGGDNRVMNVRSDGYADVYDEISFVSGIVPAVVVTLG